MVRGTNKGEMTARNVKLAKDLGLCGGHHFQKNENS